jgi:hypothetical protein
MMLLLCFVFCVLMFCFIEELILCYNNLKTDLRGDPYTCVKNQGKADAMS